MPLIGKEALNYLSKKIAKYKQSSILLKIFKHFNCTNCHKAIEEHKWLR
jgi:hypothetical protein